MGSGGGRETASGADRDSGGSSQGANIRTVRRTERGESSEPAGPWARTPDARSAAIRGARGGLVERRAMEVS